MRLYRIELQTRYNGGHRADVLQSTEVLYCGYDRLEAARVLHANRPLHKGCAPGGYYKAVVGKSREISEHAPVGA